MRRSSGVRLRHRGLLRAQRDAAGLEDAHGLASPGADPTPLEFGEGAEDLEHHPPLRGGDVEVLEVAEEDRDVAVDQPQEELLVPGEAVELGDDEVGLDAAGVAEGAVELGSVVVDRRRLTGPGAGPPDLDAARGHLGVFLLADEVDLGGADVGCGRRTRGPRAWWPRCGWRR